MICSHAVTVYLVLNFPEMHMARARILPKITTSSYRLGLLTTISNAIDFKGTMHRASISSHHTTSKKKSYSVGYKRQPEI
jgi:hypothetical protein